MGRDARFIIKRIPQSDFGAFPRFLRFNNVEFWYNLRSQPIAEKCQSVAANSLMLKTAMNGAKMICFDADINEDNPKDFNNHSQLLDHLHREFIPLCCSPFSIQFNIGFFQSENNFVLPVIGSILQMFQFHPCSVLKFKVYEVQEPIEVPLEAISNWFSQKARGIKLKDPKQDFLTMDVYHVCRRIQKNHLKLPTNYLKITTKTTTLIVVYLKLPL